MEKHSSVDIELLKGSAVAKSAAKASLRFGTFLAAARTAKPANSSKNLVRLTLVRRQQSAIWHGFFRAPTANFFLPRKSLLFIVPTVVSVTKVAAVLEP